MFGYPTTSLAKLILSVVNPSGSIVLVVNMKLVSPLALLAFLAVSQESAQAYNLQPSSHSAGARSTQQQPVVEQSRRAVFEKAAASISAAAFGVALPSLMVEPAFASGGATAGKYM